MISLLDLSAELKIAIIDYLDPRGIQSERSPQDNNGDEDDDDDDDESESGNVSRELKNIDDIINVSRVCKVLRTIAAPILYKNIIMRNSKKSGESVQAIMNGSCGDLVRQIHYRAKLDISDLGYEDHHENHEPSEQHFPDSVRAVLSSLTNFPNLDKLVVEFPFTRRELSDAFYTFQDEENEEQVARSEEERAWRTHMARTYAAIGQNGTCGPKSLELRGLVPIEISTWKSHGFRSYLGSLETFSASVASLDNGAGWCANTLDGYLWFMSRMHSFFFDYLSGTRHFSFKATDTGPPGLEGWRHTPLNLYAHQMPRLQTLCFNHVFVSQQLADFIGSHAATLERIYLDHCFSGSDCGLAANAVT